MVKIADLPSFDMAESLKTEEDIVMYLTMILENSDLAEAGIGREALYKTYCTKYLNQKAWLTTLLNL